MDDQFGGRTDDDLFFDDFEPVSNPQVVETVAAPPPPPAAVATPPVDPPKPKPAAPKPVQRPPSQQPAAKRPPTAPRGGLANSRFADKPAAAPRSPRQAAPALPPAPRRRRTRQRQPRRVAHSRGRFPPPATDQKFIPPASHPPREKPQPPPTAPTGPAAGGTTPTTPGATPGANTALNAAARLGSGANPRTKLTETELAAKMEQMRILNAEKTRKFEQAEQDERSHAEAYARGMEEARQRRKLDEEKRRRGEEERKRMDDERAKNRERKLKAMSMKEGGWDEGKDALAQEDEKRGFRGANGGVRGTKSGAGLSGSRFARDGDDAGDRHTGAGSGEERRGGSGRGRGRGRGGPGRGNGRGGRGGGFGNEHERDPAASNGGDGAQGAKPAAPAPVISTEEFPALPGKKSTTDDASLPMLSPLGRWDDEMEAFDAKLKSGVNDTE
ncbi:uncharacterized protein GLRG_07418 [Colletotrichum graminicola M1.001]|uniref:Uncharacterized protein n=1 Tax=Colletotrichum graminicola (strain M1.001 / M2 / FGSC 10212) TaxID=645133 RepID=E3QN36_COLGM|nr:uncharacterized protein GLRG_07418 [Colletotrichum graminicola M1.001]EFQ32274.1 hypothetical protein GLRG_07418 [Colletotrichum graminicola M1.001]